MYLVRCDCKKEFEIQAGQYKAGYTSGCKECGVKTRKAQHKKEWE